MSGKGFDEKDAVELLVACHRHCCVCHRFCGVKMELDHIEPKAESQDHNIENAIPVCFECHAEIHMYNDKHPKGRKFTQQELKQHKAQWLALCKNWGPDTNRYAREEGAGPIQALIEELEFNLVLVQLKGAEAVAAPLADEQLRRAIQIGALTGLEPGLKDKIHLGYALMRQLSSRHLTVPQTRRRIDGKAPTLAEISTVREALKEAHEALLNATQASTRTSKETTT